MSEDFSVERRCYLLVKHMASTCKGCMRDKGFCSQCGCKPAYDIMRDDAAPAVAGKHREVDIGPGREPVEGRMGFEERRSRALEFIRANDGPIFVTDIPVEEDANDLRQKRYEDVRWLKKRGKVECERIDGALTVWAVKGGE